MYDKCHTQSAFVAILEDFRFYIILQLLNRYVHLRSIK